MIGDFNDIHVHPRWLLNGFREALFDCELSDLEMEGHPFTWEKSRGTPRWVEERLDRVCVNDSLSGLFPSNKVVNLVSPSSDHSEIYLQIQGWRPIPRGFQFRF